MSEPSLLHVLSAEIAEAERGGAWGDAAALHGRIRSLHPERESAWLGEARALGRDGRLDEMERVVAEARGLFPGSLPVALEHVAAATRRGRADEACDRARLVAGAFVDQPGAQAALCAALNAARRHDEAERVAAEAIGRLPAHLQLLAEHARAAEGRRDWAASHARWQRLGEAFPDRPDAPLGLVLALREMRRLDEAEGVLAEAVSRHPGNRQVLEAAGLVAQVRRDWTLAAARWDAVLEHAPASQAALVGRVLALREQRRFDEAAEALAVAQGRLPASAALLSEAARLAAARGDVEGAIAAWRRLQALSPGLPQPLVEIASLLMRQQQYDAAEALLGPGLERFAGSVDMLVAHAQVAGRRRDWAEAVRRWQVAEVAHPDNVHVLGGMAEAYWGAKDEEALVPVLDRLLARQPASVSGAILYARLEMRRNKAADAVARLEAAEALNPGHPHLIATLGDARMQALVSAEPPPPRVRAAPQPRARAGAETLFERFESLGSGCEFGLLQRRFGAEPLGLLRWGTISPGGLIDMLESRFGEIGDLAHTSIRPVGENYELRDTHYRMSMQTFISTSTEPAETLLPKLCGRMKYLARELGDSMEEADRILLYKAADGITEGELDRLWAAVCGFGDNALLVVRLADAAHASGSLEVLEDGLMVGFVSRFSNKDIDVEAWTAVCQAAEAAWGEALGRRQAMGSLDAWS